MAGVERSGNPVAWAVVRRMLTADEPPTLELGVTFAGEPFARIVAAACGRGRPREKYLVVAPTLEQLFSGLAAAVSE